MSSSCLLAVVVIITLSSFLIGCEPLALRDSITSPTDLKIKLILRRADEIYQKVGLVKNVIDLMGDFASQGIRLVHRNKRIERFYRRWFNKIYLLPF